MEYPRLKTLLIFPAILLGVALAVVLVKNSSKAVRIEVAEKVTAVRIISVPEVTVAPSLTATGNVRPSRVWNSMAQVSGKVITLHPRLKQGALIKQGEVLLQIDPRDYELAIAQAETGLEAIRVQQAQVDVQEANAEALLVIERESLALAEGELQRKQKMLKRKTISQSELGKEHRSLLSQQKSVQSLINSIKLYPVDRRRLVAELRRQQAQMADAKLNLERTTILMPFNGRIAEVKVELQQFVGLGSLMMVADGIAKAEIAVQVPMERLGDLILSDEIIDPTATEHMELGKLLGLSARVLLQQNEYLIEWPARVARLSDALDPRTRTVGVIVEVERPYAQVQPGRRPPLVKGLFVDVLLSRKPQTNRIVIPLSALHGQQVYVVNQEQRLQKRTITISSKGSDYAIISAGVAAGEQVIISDLVSAVEGMLLKPVEDAAALKQLLSAIQG
ncbi:MAG: biotin/lipoyl-binding protein [Candidatus Polarisedimenticolaceae bacterium]|nr:biotin/lipoyl-binding protein [Candidatus Polarisedimenticolaceae bacterium]